MQLNSWLARLFRKLTNSSVRTRGVRARYRSGQSLTAISAIVESLEPREMLSGQTITVNSTSDAANNAIITGPTVTLREAINYENANGGGDTINFASSLSGGTITLTQGALQISTSTTITGLGANQLAISGNNASQIFVIDAAGVTTNQVSISNLTLTNGYANSTSLAQGNGGAIFNFENLTLSNTVISGNTSLGHGGGVYSAGTLTCYQDTFSGNTSNYGGGIFNQGSLISSSDTFSGNTAGTGAVSGSGGAIANFGTTISTNDTIAGNTAATGGFGGGIANLLSLTTVNDTIAGNFNGGVYDKVYWNSLNTIIAGNYSAKGSSTSLDVVNSSSGIAIVATSTLVGDANSAGGITNGVNGNKVGYAASSIFATVPGSSPTLPLLANNGGPTQTIALIASSPAIGAGSAVDTLTTSGLSNTSTTLNVTTGTFIAVGDELRIDTEIMLVTAGSGTSFTVIRGYEGTTAATHAASASIVLAYDQRHDVRGIVNNLGSYDFSVSPVIIAPSRAYVYENTSFTFAANAIVLADAENAATLDVLTLSVTHGTLTVGSTTGLTFVSGTNGSKSMTVTGTLANLNNALTGLAYTPTVGYSGPDSLAIHFQNPTNNLSSSATVAISVLGLSPSVSAPQSVSLSQGNSFAFTANNTISLSDPSGTTEQLILSVQHGILHLGSTAGLTVTGNGTATVIVSGALSALNASLTTLGYTPAAGFHGVDTLNLMDTNTSNNLTTSAAISISVNPLAPTVAGPSHVSVNQNGTVTFTGGNAITVADASGTAEKLTLIVQHGTLKFGSTAGLTVLGNGSVSVIVSGSLAALNSALTTLVYTPTAGYHGPDTLGLNVRDTSTILFGTTSIGLMVNPLPPMVTAPATVSVNKNGVANFKSSNTISVNDPSGTMEQLTLTAVHGTLKLDSTAGLTVIGNGTKTIMVSGSLAALNVALASLKYTPTTGYVGLDTLSLSVRDTGDNLTTASSVGISVN